MNDNVYRYLDDEMSPEERTAFEATLHTDPVLATMVAEMRAMMSIAASSSVTTPIPAALTSSVLTTIAPSSAGLSTVPLLLSILAGACIIFGLGWWAGSSTAVTTAETKFVVTAPHTTTSFGATASSGVIYGPQSQASNGSVATTSETDVSDVSTYRKESSKEVLSATSRRRLSTRRLSALQQHTDHAELQTSPTEMENDGERHIDKEVNVTVIDRLSNDALTSNVDDVMNTSIREQHRDVITQKLLSIADEAPSSVWYEDIDGTLRLASSITSATNSPLRPVTALERVSATVTYGVSDHHRLGLAVGSEVIPISYERIVNGARFRIDQQGAVRWIGAIHRWMPVTSDVFQPWLETTLGAWTAGYVGKAHVGATFFVSPAFGIALGVEATGITFRVDERNRAATTLGLTTAITVRPW